jgi:mannose/cellobiose epimerase-like protein (N-acyl-D-glucosamine 2-epimerase family)
MIIINEDETKIINSLNYEIRKESPFDGREYRWSISAYGKTVLLLAEYKTKEECDKEFNQLFNAMASHMDSYRMGSKKFKHGSS